MTGAYNSFFRMFDRETGRGVTLEAWRENSKPRAVLRTRRVYTGGKRRRGDVGVDSLDFTKKILHMAWHPAENIIAIAATNNLYIFQDRVNPDAQTQWEERKHKPEAILVFKECIRKFQPLEIRWLINGLITNWYLKWKNLFTQKKVLSFF